MSLTDAQRQLAGALGRIPSGLYILTARHGAQETGMLASWVQQCGFEPPLLTVCVKANRPVTQWLTPGAVFTLNILEDGQTDLIAHFGRGFALEQDAFTGLELVRGVTAAPVLEEAHAYLECQVVQNVAPGDHVLLIAQVQQGKVLTEGHPMVHIRKNGMHY